MPVQHTPDAAGPWVLIPAFNEAATIADITRRALRQTRPLVVVDDGSSDGTAEALRGLPLTLLQNSENCGKGASLWRGFRYALSAGARGVITLDGDGQHAPEDIAQVAAAARRHPDSLVIGARSHRLRRARLARYAANRLADFFIAWAAGCPIEDSQSGFRFYPAQLLQRLKIKHGKTRSFVFESEVLIECARLGYPIIAVPIETCAPGGARPSHFRPILDIARIARMLAGRILSRVLCLGGLYCSLKGSRPRGQVRQQDLERSLGAAFKRRLWPAATRIGWPYPRRPIHEPGRTYLK